MAEGVSVPTAGWTPHMVNDRVNAQTLRRELLAQSPTAKICIGGKIVNCILDTGAETSLITAKYYYEHLASVVGELSRVGSLVNLRGANDLEIPVKGYLRSEIQILGQKLTASFLVTASESPEGNNPRRENFPILLGCNILRSVAHHQGCVNCIEPGSDWDLAVKWLQLVENDKPDDCDATNDSSHIFRVKTKGSEQISPESAKNINCVLDSDCSDNKLLLLQSHLVYPTGKDNSMYNMCNDELGSSLIVLEGIQSSGPSLSLTIVNTGDEPVLIPSGTEIAVATQAEIVEEVVVDFDGEELNVSVQNVVSDEINIAEVNVESSGQMPSDMTREKPEYALFDEPGEVFVLPDGTKIVLPPGLSLRHLSSKEAVEAAKLVQSHIKAFSMGPLDLGHCDLIPHEIKLTDNRPVNLPYRRVMPSQVSEVKKMLQDLLDRNIIRRSASPYASPIVLVKKKNGQLRLCIDYRCLNAKTQRDAFPLPRIEETLESLGGSKFFSSLDLTHGYFQVSVHQESIAKTAFRVPWGLYEFLRLPQGLTNSPSTFQRVMELIFGDLNQTEVILYLDDLLVFSTTFEEHLHRLKRVLTRIEDNGLKLKGSKCRLFQRSISHLGHIVSDSGISVDPDKVAKVRDWPIPSNAAQLRSFLGLASYYRRYVKGFSAIAAPLHELCAKGPEKAGKISDLFVWSAEADKAFQILKSALCGAPVLAFPCFERDFVLEIDASLKGLGACLSQNDEEGNLHPVAYASRSLRGPERNYSDFSSFKLELLALKWAVSEKFKEYLMGRKTVVWTDNNPLAHLQTAKLGATEQRWVAQLAPFDLEVKYRTGRSNKCADALSRNPLNESLEAAVDLSFLQPLGTPIPPHLNATHDSCSMVRKVESVKELPGITSSVLPSFSFDELASLQRKDETLGKVWQLWNMSWEPGQVVSDPSLFTPQVKAWTREWPRLVERHGVLYRTNKEPGLGEGYQLLIPRSLRGIILEASHDQWGHQGVGRTLGFMKKRVFWPGMIGHVREHIQNCFQCAVTKTPTPKVRPPMRHLLSFRPLERLAIDFLKLDRGLGNIEDVLVLTDAFTKFAVAVPCRDQKAPTVARVLRDHWFSRYGVPLQLHSDRGKNFESSIISELCTLYGIKRTRTTAYHPQGNAQTERFNRTLCGLIRSLDHKNRKRWPELLPHLVFLYNSTPHSVTGYAPYTLMFGRAPMVPLDQLLNNTYNNFAENFTQKQADIIRETHKIAKQRLITAAEANKRRYDKRAHAAPLPVGSRVLLKQCAFTERHKLANTYGEQQFIVVKSNEEGDLYAIKPVEGGSNRWVNRKMLILDPRGDTTEANIQGEPSLPLPGLLEEESEADSDESSSEYDFVLAPPANSEDLAPKSSEPQPPGSDGKVEIQPPGFGVPFQCSMQGPPLPSSPQLRRSERLRRKRQGCWPDAIT